MFLVDWLTKAVVEMGQSVGRPEGELILSSKFECTQKVLTVNYSISASSGQMKPTLKFRFLLGTGRMPHPVGGAMGVACALP